jgi:hypothetical protein
MLSEVIAIPEVQAVLAARQQGQEVQVVPSDAAGSSGDGSVDEDYSELDEFGPDIKKLVGLIDKKIGAKLDPVVNKVGTLEQLAAALQKKDIHDAVAAVAAKHPDFPKYRKAMGELSRQEGMAGLGVEELLLLAKHRAGELTLSEPSTHSERPSPTPRRPGSGEKRTDLPPGRKGFKTLLSDALDKIEVPGQ